MGLGMTWICGRATYPGWLDTRSALGSPGAVDIFMGLASSATSTATSRWDAADG
jgi:hypothetical protein